MNINSLLLGSAAALIAGSGAYAADAVVVAEPEAAEYVRICDVYGAGYFYIPGTETCLRIGGYVRYDASVGDAGRVFDGATTHDRMDGDQQQTWNKNARFTLKTWTGQETELGTLKTYAETRFNFGNVSVNEGGVAFSEAGNKPVTLNYAWIQLGGLRVGKDDTVYNQFIGYAGNVIQDTIIPYGIKETNLISYYFGSGNGLTGVVSFEEGSSTDTIDSYVPHVVGGVKYKGAWGSITAVGAYNSNWEEWSGKVRVDVKPMDKLTLFLMAGYGTDHNALTSFYKPWGGNWAVWGGGSYTLNAKMAFNTQISYAENKDFGVAANVAYTIVPGYTITAELDYYDNFDKSNSSAVGGIFRFQRSF
ncbi:porin [Mesorhizobium sp. B4-1-4]|uniref:porin n=1 Tax=Mesorhizobium sp. B4-1-4 TaxID=2589888 RepID=UPI00112A8159|nr:porin [Mesorhizobium sp. B4-1-4]UCI31732.1 porin [Mesorhizobium sp. B4-1-4]